MYGFGCMYIARCMVFIYMSCDIIMYFLYVDESGQTAIKSRSSDNGLYILSGVLVHEKDWRSVEKSLVDMKQDLFPEFRSDEWELHASDIWHDREFFAKKDLNLNRAKKDEIFSRVVDIACKSEIVLVNVIVFKDMLKQRRSHAVMKYSWRRLVIRFENFLERNQIPINDGLFFIDSSHKNPDTEIKNLISSQVQRGKNNRLGDSHVIENPIFVESFRWNMIQLADMIAYVIHKHYKKDPMFAKWFKLLNSKMYRSGNRLYGVGINEISSSR